MIPGVTYHKRAVWEDPKLPVNQPDVYIPPKHNLALVEHVIAHYTAADDLIDGDPGEHASDLPAYLRAIQRDYRNRHGFSIGYSWAIDWLGGVWELRGWEYRPAATGGRLVPGVGNFNAITFAVLCLVDGNDPLTSYAVESFRRVMAEIERRCGDVDIWPHSRADPTGCCGDGIRAQIKAGQLEPSITDPHPPIPPEDDMANIPTVRPRGIADVWALMPIVNADQMNRMGIAGQAPIVLDLTPAQIAQLEAAVGYRLTPTKHGL